MSAHLVLFKDSFFYRFTNPLGQYQNQVPCVCKTWKELKRSVSWLRHAEISQRLKEGGFAGLERGLFVQLQRSDYPIKIDWVSKDLVFYSLMDPHRRTFTQHAALDFHRFSRGFKVNTGVYFDSCQRMRFCKMGVTSFYATILYHDQSVILKFKMNGSKPKTVASIDKEPGSEDNHHLVAAIPLKGSFQLLVTKRGVLHLMNGVEKASMKLFDAVLFSDQVIEAFVLLDRLVVYYSKNEEYFLRFYNLNLKDLKMEHQIRSPYPIVMRHNQLQLFLIRAQGVLSYSPHQLGFRNGILPQKYLTKGYSFDSESAVVNDHWLAMLMHPKGGAERPSIIHLFNVEQKEVTFISLPDELRGVDKCCLRLMGEQQEKVVLATPRGVVYYWDISTRMLLFKRALRERVQMVYDMAVHPEGLLISYSQSHEKRVWEERYCLGLLTLSKSNCSGGLDLNNY